MKSLKKGFTLVELLVVLAILSLLIGASIGAYSKITASAEKKKCEELVKSVAVALVKFNGDNGGCWTQDIGSNCGESGGRLDETTAVALASSQYLGLTLNSDGTALSGADKFGIVTPWAQDAIKRAGSSASLTTKVPGGGTIQDHILYCAVDLDGDGNIKNVNVGGENLNVTGTAIVWCCGKDGKLEAYSKGIKKDDVYSWNHGMLR